MMSIRTLILLLGCCPALPLAAADAASAAEDAYRQQRLELVATIADNVRDTSLYLDREALDPRVMAALSKVPRHLFVPQSERGHAYENRPLPIGHGQTISQPYIVAIMSDLLKLEPGDRVLEIGTGSGYQAAVLAELVDQLYSMEILEPLAERARTLLDQLDYQRVHSRVGDGYYGWPEQAPFDAIMVTAAAGHIPPPLVAQLKPGGRMLIPVGSRFMAQQLIVVTKDADGSVRTRQILPVRFVPLTGEH